MNLSIYKWLGLLYLNVALNLKFNKVILFNLVTDKAMSKPIVHLKNSFEI